MAKVASRSWLKLLRTCFPNRLIAHFHTISKPGFAKIDRIVGPQVELQTIKHLTLPKLGRPPPHLDPYIRNHVWIGPPTKIVAGVREPVARAASVVSFLSNRLGYSLLNVTVRDQGTAANLSELFFRALRVAQGDDPRGDTLVMLLAYALADYKRWFREELAPAFGLDISDQEFDQEKRVLRLTRRHDLLVYRLEDLESELAKQQLLASAGDFLGIPIHDFPRDETSHERRYRALYAEFVASLKLSNSDLAWFYEDHVVRKFYGNDEIDKFCRRWVRNPVR